MRWLQTVAALVAVAILVTVGLTLVRRAVKVQREDRGNDGGGSLWAAAELGQRAPGLQGGDGAFADCADLGVGRVVVAHSAGQVTAVERRADRATGAAVALVGDGGDRGVGERGDDACARP